MRVFPLARTRDSTVQRCLRATGSTPVDGSSKKTTCGSPISATAVLNLRLLPPLQIFQQLPFIHLLDEVFIMPNYYY